MAAVPEFLAVPRSSALPSPTSALVTASSVSSLSGHGISVRSLPEFNGLKIRPTRSLGSVNLGPRLGRGGRIVCEARETTVEVPGVTDANWKLCVLDCDTPVLVEFWAPWCGPCRMIHPVINELAKQYAGKLKCYKVNTDECPSIATEYGIRSIPTVIIFKDGEKKDAVIGAVPKSTLTSSIDKFL